MAPLPGLVVGHHSSEVLPPLSRGTSTSTSANTGATAQFERVLGSLGPLSQQLSVVIVKEDIDISCFNRYGFCQVFTPSTVKIPICADAVLFVADPADIALAVGAVGAFNRSQQMPTILAVLVADMVEPSDGFGWDKEACALTGRTEVAREALLEAGADSVTSVFGDEVLTPHRVMECIQTVKFMANKVAEIVKAEVSFVEDKAARKLHQAHRKFLMMLAGRVLENIPSENAVVPEIRSEAGMLTGVGKVMFQTRLGSGAFGHVLVGQHEEYGVCAVKAIPKSMVKNASILVSLDRELGHMLYMEPHPHVVRAIEVLHTVRHFFVVMEYAGALHLSKHTKYMLEQSNEPVLRPEVVQHFASQQAAAVVHLHSCNVCHRDIKPDNWIVSDDQQQILRLADFGLAVQLTGPSQVLKQSCGSLPFCAPEVFASDPTKDDCAGYDGLAADIWSLGVNFMELICGPFSIEASLGWLPNHPTEFPALLQGLNSIPEHWAGAYDEKRELHAKLADTVSFMLRCEPCDRAKIGQVVARSGFSAHLEPRPPRSGCRRGASRPPPSRFSSRAASASPVSATPSPPVTPSSSTSPPRPSRQALEAAPSQEEDATPTLSVRAGGAHVISHALRCTLDQLLWTRGFGEVLKSAPSVVVSLRALYMEQVETIFDCRVGGENEKRVRDMFVKAHKGLYLLPSHFKVMLDVFRVCLEFSSLGKDVIEAIIAQFSRFEEAVTHVNRTKVAKCAAVCTQAWRSDALASLQPTAINAFAKALASSSREAPAVAEVMSKGYTADDIEARTIKYFKAQDGGTGMLSWAADKLSKVDHLSVIHVALHCMEDAGWPAAIGSEAVDMLYGAMLHDWDTPQQ